MGLLKEKESLEAKLAAVVAEIESIETGKPAPKKRGRKPGRPPGSKSKVAAVVGKPRKRGKRLKVSLLKLLSSAGSSGMAVKDIAAKLKVKPGNIFSWFYTTGKKIKGISKVGEAKYAYTP